MRHAGIHPLKWRETVLDMAEACQLGEALRDRVEMVRNGVRCAAVELSRDLVAWPPRVVVGFHELVPITGARYD